MAYRRMVVRCENSNNLNGTQQKDFADDVKSRLEGSDLRGYFVVSGGNNWLEWEGDATTVQQKVNQHLSDSRVTSYDIVEDTEVNSLNLSKWRAHTEPDIHCDLP